VERLVSLIQGEEGRETSKDEIEDLVKEPRAEEGASISDDLDVVEV
jgi:hypothetical protein